MPKEFVWNEYNLGWCPSDDSQNGRKNALLRMDNVELDKNGSLSLVGGTKLIQELPSVAFNLFSTIQTIDDVLQEVIYSSTVDGGINKSTASSTTNISLPGTGDTEIAAFANGINQVLIASGDVRLKDTQTGTNNLGLPNAPVLALSEGTPWYTDEFEAPQGRTCSYQWQFYPAGITGPTTSNRFTYTSGSSATLFSIFSATFSSGIYNWNVLAEGGDGSTIPQSQDSDVLTFTFTAASGDLSAITSIELVFVVDPANPGQGIFTASTGTINLIGLTQYTVIFHRSDFSININPLYEPWIMSDVIWQINCGMTDTNLDVYFSQTIIPIVDAALDPVTDYSTHFAFYNGLNNTESPVTYTYTAIYANVSSDYVALGGGLDAYNNKQSIYLLENQNVLVTIVIPTTLDPQVNQLWLFREGNNLPGFYQTAVLDINASSGTVTILDWVDDQTVLDIDIVLNINTSSVQQNNEGLDKIYSIIGPIQGRWYYFATSFMYPSDLNDPDLIDINLGIRTCSDQNEVFLWAVKVAEGYTLVGTTVDIYVLSGTFETLADGSIDIYYRPMVCKYPPITRQVSFSAGEIYYMAADGWRAIGTDASTSRLLVAPNTDQLYNNIDRYGYSGVDLTASAPSTLIFPVDVTKNKLYCCVNDRIEVFDFTRNYWRPVNYGLGTVQAITSSVYGYPIASFLDQTIQYIDVQSQKLIGESGSTGTVKQSVSVLSAVFDPDSNLNRNDLYTLKVRLITGAGENLSVSIVTKDNTSYFIGNATSYTDIEKEIILDVNSIIPFPTETFQFLLTGQFSQLVISDIRILYDPRPNQLTAMRIYNSNFNSPSKKRVRMWPCVIDTLGNDTFFKVIVDNTNSIVQKINTTEKTTVPIFINFDAFGVDYGALITGGPFEFWEMGNPEIVQTLPTPKMYDQVGPQELFRYGKVREFALRLLPYGGSIGTTSQLPYVVYFDDYSIYNETITVNNGQEQTYSFGLPKGIAGTIIRIELGPVNYQFIKYYLKAKLMVHGDDTTDNSKWINL